MSPGTSGSGPGPEVVITGLGAISPFGGAADTSAALAGGESGLLDLGDELICVLDHGADPAVLLSRRAGRVEYDPRQAFAGRNFRPVDRTGQLVILAAREALSASGWSQEARAGNEVGLVLGTMFGSVHTISAFDRRGLEAGPKYVKPLDFANSVINAAAGQAAIWLGLTGTNSTLAGGAAAGVLAIAQATQLIRDGRALALLAGGAEELSYEGLLGFEKAGHLSPNGRIRPFDAARDGTLLGEGAALLMVEDASSAAARSAPVLARVLGHGNAFDTSRGRDPRRAAAALERSIRLALQDAAIRDAALDRAGPGDGPAVDAVFCGACGLPGDVAEGLALASVLGDGVPVSGVAGSFGCALGAAGAFQALAALAAFEQGRLPPLAGLETPDAALPALDFCFEARAAALRRVLLTAASLDGVVAALVLEGAT